jgi:hypothetical protein
VFYEVRVRVVVVVCVVVVCCCEFLGGGVEKGLFGLVGGWVW